jgi:polysaccharide biosynthesis/export protein
MKYIRAIAVSTTVCIWAASLLFAEESLAPTQVAIQPLSSDEYLVQPDDVLQITVYEEPDLTTKVRVTGRYEINFPLLGRVNVSGLSVIAVQEKITALLDDGYLVNPQVQVFIEEFHVRNVFVTGSVNQPGSYALIPGKATTVMEAIAMAGGFHTDASVNNTRIIRISDGIEQTINVHAKEIMSGNKTLDVEVMPNDVIVVPESIF